MFNTANTNEASELKNCPDEDRSRELSSPLARNIDDSSEIEVSTLATIPKADTRVTDGQWEHSLIVRSFDTREVNSLDTNTFLEAELLPATPFSADTTLDVQMDTPLELKEKLVAYAVSPSSSDEVSLPGNMSMEPECSNNSPQKKEPTRKSKRKPKGKDSRKDKKDKKDQKKENKKKSKSLEVGVSELDSKVVPFQYVSPILTPTYADKH